MYQKISRALRNRKGFTLVELMVVVVIIGILVAIAIPIYNNVQGNAQANACKANQRTISGAAAQYAAENSGDFPDNVAGLASYLQNTSLTCPEHGTSYNINQTTGQAERTGNCLSDTDHGL